MNKIISKIKNQPQEYIDKISLKRMMALLWGYGYAKAIFCSDIETNINLPFFYLYLAHNKIIPSDLDIETYCQQENITDYDGYFLFIRFFDKFLGESFSVQLTEQKLIPLKNIERIDEKNISELLKSIESKPLMFLKTKSIERLYYFVKGFSLFDYDNYTSDVFIPEPFSKYIQEMFKTKETNWYSVIISVSKDEESGFDLFYNLFNSYLETKK